MSLTLTPVTREDVRAFVAAHHRHNKPPLGGLFQVGVREDGVLVGVAIASRPVARALDDGRTIEITRACTLGTPNANSMLYAALCRAAKALGYERAYTYTLAEESGVSLKASGFRLDADLKARPSWSCPSRSRNDVNLFGEEQRPAGPKLRWKRLLEVAA